MQTPLEAAENGNEPTLCPPPRSRREFSEPENGSVLTDTKAVYCFFGCCPGTGDRPWDCCSQFEEAQEMDWCVIVLLIILFSVIITLLIAGTCASYFYLHRMTLSRQDYSLWRNEVRENPRENEERRAPTFPLAPAAPGQLGAAPYYGGLSPYGPAGGIIYPTMTPDQQAMVAQYWQAAYQNYMKQMAERGGRPAYGAVGETSSPEDSRKSPNQ